MNALVLNIQKILYQYDLPRSLPLTFILSFFHDGSQVLMAALEVMQVFPFMLSMSLVLILCIGPVANFWVNHH